MQELLVGFVSISGILPLMQAAGRRFYVCPAGEFSFSFDEAAFDSSFEDGGFVALEVGFDALKVGNGFVEMGELFFDFRDDTFLLVERCDHHFNCVIVIPAQARYCCRFIEL